MRKLMTLILALGLSACATTRSPQTPAQRLETTPRHNEWVQVKNGARTVHAYVAYPEVATKAPAVLVIHENRGLTDWERSVVDRLAEKGYLAIAPDLLSGMAPNGGRASDFASADAAREAISKLPPDQVTGDLDAVADYVLRDPAASGKLYTAGFCWGGGRTWLFANHRRNLSAAFPFYGPGPQDAAGVANIDAPVFAFYGGADARIGATVPKTQELMLAAGKRFDPVTYDGAGHAFMRAGEAPDATEPNRRAHDQAWTRWLELMGDARRSQASREARSPFLQSSARIEDCAHTSHN